MFSAIRNREVFGQEYASIVRRITKAKVGRQAELTPLIDNLKEYIPELLRHNHLQSYRNSTEISQEFVLLLNELQVLFTDLFIKGHAGLVVELFKLDDLFSILPLDFKKEVIFQSINDPELKEFISYTPKNEMICTEIFNIAFLQNNMSASNWKISKEFTPLLRQALEGNHSLRILELSGKISTTAFKEVSEQLESLYYLEILHLDQQCFSGDSNSSVIEGGKALANILSRLPGLKYLYLNLQDINADIVEALYNALKNCPKTHISISLCGNKNIDDNAVEHICRLVASCGDLRVLNLSNNGITDKGARELMRVIELCCPKLERVHLRGNPVSPVIEQNIKAILEVKRNAVNIAKAATGEDSLELPKKKAKFTADKNDHHVQDRPEFPLASSSAKPA